MVAIAAISWVTDQVLCTHLNNVFNPQLHSFWHVLMSLSAHYALLFELILRNKLANCDLKIRGNVVLFADTNPHHN